MKLINIEKSKFMQNESKNAPRRAKASFFLILQKLDYIT